MNTKLTLKLNEGIIIQAKDYAKKKNTSLSQLIESYLELLTSSNTSKDSITPLVKSLSGVIKLPDNFDHKKNYKGHIIDKYSK